MSFALFLDPPGHNQESGCDVLSQIHSIHTVIRGSSKCKTLFLCPFLQEVLCNLPEQHLQHCHVMSLITAMLELLTTMAQDRLMNGETKAKLSGLYEEAKQLRTYFGLVCVKPRSDCPRHYVEQTPLFVQPWSPSKCFSNIWSKGERFSNPAQG